VSAPPEPALLVAWERLLGELLDRTARFPKSVRFTFAARLDGLALDVLDRLVRARFAGVPERRRLLAEADGALAVLRVLLRVSHDRRFLDRGGLESLAVALDEAGRMLGGWRASLEGR
jgi:hypothetical protein